MNRKETQTQIEMRKRKNLFSLTKKKYDNFIKENPNIKR